MPNILTRGLALVKNALLKRGMGLAGQASGNSNGIYDPSALHYLLGKTRSKSLFLNCTGKRRLSGVSNFNLLGSRRYLHLAPIHIKGTRRNPNNSTTINLKGVLKVPEFWSFCLIGRRRLSENRVGFNIVGARKIVTTTTTSVTGARRVSGGVQIETTGKRDIATLLEALDLL